MKAARLAWFEGQLDLDPDRLVFLDETATNTKMARRYGWAPRGERCRVAVPFGHWKTVTVTAGLRASGLTATALFDGPMTGVRFRRYVEETLVPTLNQGDTVVLDNLPAHKVSGIRERIEGRPVPACSTCRLTPQTFNPCMDGSCGSRMSDRFGVNWSVAAMYTASDLQRDRCAP